MSDDSSAKSGFNLNLLLFAVFGALVTLVGYISIDSKKPSFVSFDVSKLANAQRALASKVIGSTSPDYSTITQVGANVETMIETVSNGAVVLVKQSVVMGNIPDITDQVLAGLGLPLDAPTLDVKSRFQDDFGETNFSSSNAGRMAKHIWEVKVKNTEATIERKRAEALP